MCVAIGELLHEAAWCDFELTFTPLLWGSHVAYFSTDACFFFNYTAQNRELKDEEYK